MQITNFRISNYKSFNEPVQFEFCSGMNVITGQNNAGKTALLEGISARFEGNGRSFPIHWITTRSHPQESGKVGVVVSPFDAELERPDLHVPLEHCGTGVAQVLAILYVVIHSDSPQVIIIDEPQSFLHPGAARKLIQILKGHPEHQYVIATHSPAIISATGPERTFMLKLRDGETFVEMMDATATAAQERCLLELGEPSCRTCSG